MNLIFLPMAFLSGLWLPLQFMPKFLGDIAPIWPAYHLAQMALDTVGAPSAGTIAGHVAVLAGITLLFFLLAMRRMHGSGFRLLGARPKRTLAIAAGVDRGGAGPVTLRRVRWQAGKQGGRNRCNGRSLRCRRHARSEPPPAWRRQPSP